MYIQQKHKPEIKVPIVWVLGGPGSGKGTQCEKIVVTYGFVHLSTGVLLRDEVKSGSPKGRKLKAIMDTGQLVGSEIVIELILDAIVNNMQNARGFLIDGFPRKHEQGILFEEKIAPVTLVLFFELPDEIMLDRLRHRAKTSDRSDDKDEIMTKRIHIFHSEKDMIFKHYGSKLKKINANRSPEEIFADVERCLNQLVQPL